MVPFELYQFMAKADGEMGVSKVRCPPVLFSPLLSLFGGLVANG
jgi:hypothetical protein